MRVPGSKQSECYCTNKSSYGCNGHRQRISFQGNTQSVYHVWNSWSLNWGLQTLKSIDDLRIWTFLYTIILPCWVILQSDCHTNHEYIFWSSYQTRYIKTCDKDGDCLVIIYIYQRTKLHLHEWMTNIYLQIQQR